MYMNDVQHVNVTRALEGAEKLIDKLKRKLHDKSINGNMVALDEIANLIEHAKNQLR